MKPHTDLSRCYFCEEKFRLERGTTPADGMYAEEVGEWWSASMQDSVLGHPDCLPGGVETVLMGEDPEWQMA
jgi:hypothetical protein